MRISRVTTIPRVRMRVVSVERFDCDDTQQWSEVEFVGGFNGGRMALVFPDDEAAKLRIGDMFEVTCVSVPND